MSIDPRPAMPGTTDPVLPRRALCESAFRTWLQTAHPGGLIEYHRGHLCVDRQPKLDAPDNQARAALHRLALAAIRAAEQSLVHLVQQRHGREDFSYLAIKASKAPRARHHGSRSPERTA